MKRQQIFAEQPSGYSSCGDSSALSPCLSPYGWTAALLNLTFSTLVSEGFSDIGRRLRAFARFPRRLIRYSVFFVCSVALLACGHRTNELGADRPDASTTTQLFTAVWSPRQFAAEDSKPKIAAALSSLIRNFHNLDRKPLSGLSDPPSQALLRAHRAVLLDIQDRLESGSKESARLRLQGLTQSCIACHVRKKASINFIGALPVFADHSFESQLAAAEFLFATRQFDKANDAFFALARKMGLIESGSLQAIQALQLWLMEEVGVKRNFAGAEQRLQTFLSETRLKESARPAVESWKIELHELNHRPVPNIGPLTEAQDLLHPIETARSIEDDNSHLVKTLYAASLLHKVLEQSPPSGLRGKAVYLLGLAYAHLPIRSAEVLRDLYLQECIFEFPGTLEAQRAYQLYENFFESEHAGNGQLHLEADQIERLVGLRRLAFGEEA
jgi:hypothetical protein